jgi:alcohol oxidase
VGHVHITSDEDVNAPPDFDPAYCSRSVDWANRVPALTTIPFSGDDFELLNFLYKKTREFARRMPSFRGEYLPGHPQFSAASKVVASDSGSPVEIESADLRYDSSDEEAIKAHTRANGKLVGHILSPNIN